MKRDCRWSSPRNHILHKPTDRAVRPTTSAPHSREHMWRSASLGRPMRRAGTDRPGTGRRSIFLNTRHERNGRKLWLIPHDNSHLVYRDRRHTSRPGAVLVSTATRPEPRKPSRVDIVDASSRVISHKSPWRFVLTSRLWLQYIMMVGVWEARRAGRSEFL